MSTFPNTEWRNRKPSNNSPTTPMTDSPFYCTCLEGARPGRPYVARERGSDLSPKRHNKNIFELPTPIHDCCDVLWFFLIVRETQSVSLSFPSQSFLHPSISVLWSQYCTLQFLNSKCQLLIDIHWKVEGTKIIYFTAVLIWIGRRGLLLCVCINGWMVVWWR